MRSQIPLHPEESTEEASAKSLLSRGSFIVTLNRDEGDSTIYTHHGRADTPYIMSGRIVDTAGSNHMSTIGFLIEFLRTGGELSRAG